MTQRESHSTRTVFQLFTTVDTREAAESIAQRLVEQKLAGCVQIGGPICSTYSWQGAIEQTMEFRLTIKTTSLRLNQVIVALKEWHPYDTPEILWAEVFATEGYFSWLEQFVGAS